MGKIKTSKKGIIATSDATGISYRVFKWEDLGKGRIRCITKTKINVR